MTKKVSFSYVLGRIFIIVSSVLVALVIALLIATLFELSDEIQDTICSTMLYSMTSLLGLVLIYQVYLVALGKKSQDRFTRLSFLFLVSPAVTIVFVMALEASEVGILLELLEKYNLGIVTVIIYAAVLATGLLIKSFREIFFTLRRLRLA
ncbi:MAG: hypothetical protein WAW11_03465 [Patescibacteria group bacterium]